MIHPEWALFERAFTSHAVEFFRFFTTQWNACTLASVGIEEFRLWIT